MRFGARARARCRGCFASRSETAGSGRHLLSLLTELRALEKQAAEELGQWGEKCEPAGDGAPAPTSVKVTFVRPLDALSDA